VVCSRSSVALNSFSFTLAANANTVLQAGPVITPLKSGKARISVSTDGPYGAGESLAIAVSYVAADGSVPNVVLATLDDSNTTTGAADVIEVDGLDFPVDAALAATLTYTAGGTPNDPVVSCTVELL
jgi:hypothetical protein